jgi:hypothetical protein
MDLEKSTRLSNIFHTIQAPHSHQQSDRRDEHLVVLTVEQIDMLNDSTTAFLKMYYVKWNIEELQQKSDCLLGLDKHSARYLIVLLGVPQLRNERGWRRHWCSLGTICLPRTRLQKLSDLGMTRLERDTPAATCQPIRSDIWTGKPTHVSCPVLFQI